MIIGLGILLALFFAPAAARPADAPNLTGQRIVERGLHHRVVQTTNGGSYTELSTGMHFIRGGQLFESQENVLIDANGYGVADQGQHSARFSSSITDSPAVVYTDPDGNQITALPGIDVIGSAFRSDMGVENEPMQMPGGGYVWFEVAGIKPSRERNLDEVRARVEEKWHEDQVSERLKAKAAEIIDNEIESC